MPAALVAVASAAAAAAVSSIPAIAALGPVWAAVIGALAGSIVAFAGSALFGLNEAPKVEGSGAVIPALDSVATVKHHYGRVRHAGAIVFRATRPKENEQKHKLFYQIQVLSGSPIDGIEEVWVDNNIVALDENGQATETPLVRGPHIFFTAEIADGRQTVASPLLRANVPERLDESAVGFGCAYIAWEALYDTKAYPDGQLPKVSVTLRGRRVYDPRLDPLHGGVGPHRMEDESSWEWSDNPALCIADYARQEWGMRWRVDRIDWDSVITAANICDEQVPDVNGEMEKRYRLWGPVDTATDPAKVLEQMLSAMAGIKCEVAGKFVIYAGAFRLSNRTIDEGCIAGPVSFRETTPLRERINVVRGTFLSEAHKWAPTDYPQIEDAASIAQIGERALVLDQSYAPSISQAQRVAAIRFAKANAGKRMEVPLDLSGLALCAGAMVNVTREANQLNQHPMLITNYAVEVDGDAPRIAVTLEEELPEFYVAPVLKDIEPPPTFAPRNSFIAPGPPTVQTIQHIPLGVIFRLAYDREADHDYYEMWGHTSSIADFNVDPVNVTGTATKFDESGKQYLMAGGLTVDQDYWFYFRTIDRYGNESEFTEYPEVTIGKIQSAAVEPADIDGGNDSA